MKNIFLVDLTKDKSKINDYISNTLIENIKNTLNEWKKTILYLNKRWAYNLLICQNCWNIEKCPRCDLALSVHSSPLKLQCHHCNFFKEISLSCEKCSGVELKSVWVWTQQIETSIKKIFPDKKIFRFDSDSVWNKTQKSQTLENIKNSDIIIWTKMITTGFDFDDVKTIWVILIEQELQIPKYDTEEKIYSNIKQLIWRAWRKWKESNVIIQSFAVDNEIIKDIIFQNYKTFFQKTLNERKLFNYPPFCEYCTIRYKNKSLEESKKFIENFYNSLDKSDKNLEIIKLNNYTKRDNQYFWKIIIKWQNIRQYLQNYKKEILSNKDLVVIFE